MHFDLVKKIWSTDNGEQLIANIARVSNPKNQESTTYKGLIKYLITHSHWSPFEMVNLCVEINTTRAISAQILRHRSFSFQEFSQRYATVDELTTQGVIPTFELRRQDLTNRQNSIDDIPEDIQLPLQMEVKKYFEDGVELYSKLLSSGVAKECARSVLPMCSPTRIYMNGSLRSWIHYLQLRSKNGTQKEHADIANEIIDSIIKVEFPVVYEICFQN